MKLEGVCVGGIWKELEREISGRDHTLLYMWMKFQKNEVNKNDKGGRTVLSWGGGGILL